VVELEVVMLPGAERVVEAHRAAGQQPDNLCGPQWLSTALRAFGAADVTPERAALAAGTTVPASGDPLSWVPRGAVSGVAYAEPIPTVEDASVSGTSVRGMLAAVEELSGGARRFVPLRGFCGAPFSPEAVSALVDGLLARPAWEVVPLANIRTGALWGTRPEPADVFAYLAGAEISPPEAEWDVGHFFAIAGVVRGSTRRLAIVRDTYPHFGWGAHHLQPFEALAAALRRNDGYEGGFLLFVSAEDEGDVEGEMKEIGFDIGSWDNGTPDRQGGVP
jgi:hypothetical protein